jgi:hypothetical protein
MLMHRRWQAKQSKRSLNRAGSQNKAPRKGLCLLAWVFRVVIYCGSNFIASAMSLNCLMPAA